MASSPFVELQTKEMELADDEPGFIPENPRKQAFLLYFAEIMETLKKCSVCGEIGKFKCSNCKAVNYCCKDHQKAHWKIHKHFCFPILLGWDEVRGNELVATRDVAQGEVILREKPIVCGPSGKSDVATAICLGCHNLLMSQSYKCSKCKWPLCSEKCEKESIHADYECKIFQTKNIQPFFQQHHQYEYLFIMRCVLLKIVDPLKWKAFLRFESHMEERETNLMESLLVHGAIEFIRNTCGQADVIEEKDVRFASGVINTNAMGHGDIYVPGKTTKCGSQLFSQGCLICHSCTPNTYRAIQPNGDLHVRAILPIKSGQPFLTTYTDLALTSQERKTYLSTFYYFTCTCPRCSDPTELGTYFSAVKCDGTACGGKGYLNQTSADLWTCDNKECGEETPAAAIATLITSINTELEGIGAGDTVKCVDELEQYLRKHLGISLHPNHALIYRAEYNIIQIIDYMLSASLITEQSTRVRLIKRQIGLVRKALELMSTFWRGYSSYRGLCDHLTLRFLQRIDSSRLKTFNREFLGFFNCKSDWTTGELSGNHCTGNCIVFLPSREFSMNECQEQHLCTESV